MDKVTDGFRRIKWRSTLDVNLRTRPLRLLLVVDSLDMGGAERHVIALGSGLAEVGPTLPLRAQPPVSWHLWRMTRVSMYTHCLIAGSSDA
jgi:hypothetical protein